VIGPWPPARWPTVPLGYRYDVLLGKMLQPVSAAEDDEMVPYLRARDVQWGGVQLDDLPQMWASSIDRNHYAVETGDLLVLEGGDAGRGAILGDFPQPQLIIQKALHRVRGTHTSLRWLLYCLEALHDSGWFDVVCNASTIRHLTSEKLCELPVPDAPEREQVRLVGWLDAQCRRLDLLETAVTEQVGLLAQRKSESVAAAVFGGSPSSRHFGLSREEVETDSGWSTTRMKDAVIYLNRGIAPTYTDDATTGVLVYNQKCTRPDGSVDLTLARPHTALAGVGAERAVLQPGDVLLNSTGRGTLGRVARFPGVAEIVLADGHVTILRALEGRFSRW
jgi:type I restriction enzyme S subunit